jgi:hypothetical protein
VLREEFGAERAEALLKRAIYRRGCAVGERFRRHAPTDLPGLRDAFLQFIPDEGRMFEPEVRQCDQEALRIHFHRCPLKEAWQEAGFDGEELATLCRIAGIVDNGTFEQAGFDFETETWTPGREGCCRLTIRPGPTKERTHV